MTVVCCKKHFKEGLEKEGNYTLSSLENETVKGVKITVSKSNGGQCEFCSEQSEYTLWNDAY